MADIIFSRKNWDIIDFFFTIFRKKKYKDFVRKGFTVFLLPEMADYMMFMQQRIMLLGNVFCAAGEFFKQSFCEVFF